MCGQLQPPRCGKMELDHVGDRFSVGLGMTLEERAALEVQMQLRRTSEKLAGCVARDCRYPPAATPRTMK